MNANADVVIVGGGVTGLSTALHLKQLGVDRVVVLERHHVGAGQSGRAAGIVRTLVPHPQVAAWQYESLQFMLNFAERFDVPLEVNQPGYLLVACTEEQPLMDRAVATAVQVGAKAKRISADEARTLQPGIRQADDCVYVYEPGAIHVDPMPTTQALAVAARRAGAQVVEGCQVGDLLVEADRVVGVQTTGEAYHAGAVMIATSVWGRAQLERVGVDLPVFPHRAEMAFFHVPMQTSDQLLRIVSDTRTHLYLRSEGRHQMFVGWREGDFVTCPEDCVAQDPDSYRQTATYDRLTEMHRRLSHTLTFMDEGFVHRTYACVYDYTPDGQPILDIAGPKGLYFALGFSGAGFSTWPCVGRTMAQFIASGAKPDQIEWLSLDRFEQGRLIHWSNAMISDG